MYFLKHGRREMINDIRVKRIWLKDYNKQDSYVHFYGKFRPVKGAKTLLDISCDGSYAVFLNGKIAGFDKCADYPHYRIYDKCELEPVCDKDNDIEIVVWYGGEKDASTYIAGTPGLVFCIYQNENILLKSDGNILSGLDSNYVNGRCKTISRQMGYGYAYDNTADKPIIKKESEELSDKAEKYNLNKCGKLYLRARVKTKIKKMPNGYLIDLGKEYVGFLDMDFISDSVQDIKVAYSEHIYSGDVEWQIGKLDFSIDFKAKTGTNVFLNTFRRFACRYIRLFCDEIKINYVGIRPVEKRLITVKRTFKDTLLQKIYNASVETLKGCMHEHYEDGPYREQAMYIFDTRNQMLCGYFAFKGFSFQKENLLFIAKGQKEDGFMPITSPTELNLPIPLFSLTYILLIYEYIRYTGDTGIYDKVKTVLKNIMKAFVLRVDETGLIAQFPYPYWNYYDWNVNIPNLGNYANILRKPEDAYVKKYDVIINCAYICACKWYSEMSGEVIDTTNIEIAVKNHFFDEKKGLFTLEEGTQIYTKLGNSFAILAGLGDEKVAGKMISDIDVVDVSLSMNPFCYDALLKFGDKYKNYVLNDIKKKFGMMLDAGFSTFWETDGGPQETGNTMLHGWSAFPAYYLPVYFSDK